MTKYTLSLVCVLGMILMHHAASWITTTTITIVGIDRRRRAPSSSDPLDRRCRDGRRTTTCSELRMGLFEAFSKAFQNQQYGPPPEQVRATARHILVPTLEEAQIVMKMISSGEQSFEQCVEDFSTCPSRSRGGSLGSFGPGTMVQEFDQVVFNPDTPIGTLNGPVLTQFGHHIIIVDKRTGGGDWY